MKKKIIINLVIAFLIILVNNQHAVLGSNEENNELPGENSSIHSNYTKDTNACKSCHSVHTAVGPSLLRWSTTYETCMACHDGTMSITYNVVKGFIGDTGQRTHGGMFGIGKEESLSNHSSAGAVKINSAPGGSAEGYLARVDEEEKIVSWDIEMNCVKCHTPHGEGGNARLLRLDPNGIAYRNKQIELKLTKINNEATEFVAYSAEDVFKNSPLTILITYPYNKDIIFTENGKIVKDWMIDNQKGYSIIRFATKKETIFASFYPGIKVNFEFKNKFKENEKISYLNGINDFCGACHTDYNTSQIDQSASFLSGTYSVAYRHRVGIVEQESNYAFAPSQENGFGLNYEQVNDKKTLVCLTCHFAHGTSKELWQDTLEFKGHNGGEFSISELSGSSALKRMPNMGVCKACHMN